MKILISEKRIQKRIKELAKLIAAETVSDLYCIIIMKGGVFFGNDLLRKLHTLNISTYVDFLHLSSYQNKTHSSGEVRLLKDIDLNVAGKEILIVDDILDTGNTLSFAVNHLKSRGCGPVRSCMLLEKPERRSGEITADYVGFSIPDTFVAGYGLDYKGRLRELPYIVSVE